MVTAKSASKSSITNDAIHEFAKKIGIDLVKMGPSWAWFQKLEGGVKKHLAKTNDAVWEILQTMAPKKPVKPKKLHFWSGDGVGVLRADDATLRGDAADVRVYIAATSRAALVRMVHAYRKVERPSIEYRVKTHWKREWDAAMAGINAEAGIWVQYEADEQPVRVA